MRYVFGIFVVFFVVFALFTIEAQIERALDRIDSKLNKIEFDNAQDRAARMRMEGSK